MRLRWRVATAALLVATAVPLAVTASIAEASAAAPATQQVTMSNFAFVPSSVDVPAGTTVQWTNHDTAPHDVTVTSGPVSFHSPMLSTGQSWSYEFTVAGTYDYICSIHPDMHASLTVRPAAAATSTSPGSVAASRQASTVPANAAPLGLSVSTHPGGTPTHTAARHTATSTAPSPAATTTVTVAAAANPATSREIKPLLVIAGLVAAVATFCLLLLASSRDTPSRT